MFKPDPFSKKDLGLAQKEKDSITPANFDQIYKKFKKPILNYVSRRIDNEDIAEEITQEIFLKAFRYKEDYQNQFRISTWLWSIAKNTIIDWKRKNRSTQELLASFSIGDDSIDIEQAPDPALNIESIIINQENRQAIMKLTGSLTELQRKVFLMRMIDQLSYSEISSQLELTLSAAKCLFHRAKTSISLTHELSNSHNRTTASIHI